MPTGKIKILKKYIRFRPNIKYWRNIAPLPVFTLLCACYPCLAETDESAIHKYYLQLYERNRSLHTISISASEISKENKYLMSASNNITAAVAVIENRFIATGTVTDVKRGSEGIQKFTLHIKIIEQYDKYPNLGSDYVGKEAEILSEIGIPASFQPGAEVSVVLSVSGDEWGQYLFLVEVIDNETKK